MNVSGTLQLSSIWIMQSHTTQNFRKGKMNELHIERLPHPDYSPDISSNDFFSMDILKIIKKEDP